jgi:ferredoxin--NADP+ reductase
MAYLANFKTENSRNAVIKDSKRLTPLDTDEIREIVLEVEDKDFKCEIDQSFGVLIDYTGEFGNTQHHRLYSVADLPEKKNGNPLITMLVKRCSYIDEYSGEMYKGVASNYLCDRKVGDKVSITGPFELPFKVPEDRTSNLS